MGQASGFVLYETTIEEMQPDPVKLTIDTIRDRAVVYVNMEPRGMLDRGQEITVGIVRCLQYHEGIKTL